MKSIRTETGKAVAFINRGPDAEANARAIAAVPELLAALKTVLDPRPTRDALGNTIDAWQAAHNAIAKAEGRIP